MDITPGYLDDLRKISEEDTLTDHYDIGYIATREKLARILAERFAATS